MNHFGNKKKTKSLRATNIELESRDISISNDEKKIYTRDYDNLYPLRIEKIINNSPTGKRCSNLMAKYIIGNGVEKEKNIIVNKKKEKLNKVVKKAAQDIASQYGVYFHISFGLDINTLDEFKFKCSGINVLDYVCMAKSKEDDDGFLGKFYFLELEENKNLFYQNDTIWYYPYNNDKKVILDQMKNDCKLANIQDPSLEQLIQNYRGQVYYLNLTPKYIYSLPIWDSVYDDMDSEYRISKYINTQTRNGWLGKTIIKKFNDDMEEDNERSPNNSDTFNEQLKKNIGAEGSSKILVVDVPPNIGDVDKAFKVDQLKAQYDDKLFESTVKSLRKNIMGAFNNAPEILLTTADGALFGTNSETYCEAKKFYWEQNEWERQELEETLTEILGFEISFNPINGIEK